jgi:hypothetical protein
MSIALTLGMIFFITIYFLPQKIAITALILLIPFQLIESGFGTLNMILTYIIGIGLILNNQLDRLPFLKFVLFVILSYLLTLSQVNPSSYMQHIIYMISIISNFLLFYIIYNFILKIEDYKYFFKILVLLNILTIIYTIYQFGIGFESHTFLGIGELTIKGSKEMVVVATDMVERRLRGGPFEAIGMNAEYLVIQIIIIGYLFIYETQKLKKIGYLALILINFMILIGTGNRGGFFSLIAGLLLFYYFFGKELGGKRIIGSIFIFGFLFTVVSFVIISYTPYDSIFRRIEKTEIKKGVPDTRENVWKIAYEGFKQKPILGWGPRIEHIYLYEFNEKNGNTQKIDYSEIPSPHSLYLYLLYTIGIFGLAAYLIFLGNIFIKFFKFRNINNNNFLDGLPKLGVIILLVFLLDQVKLEFLRHTLHDYQHYVFMIFAAFLAFTELIKVKTNNIK